MITFEHASARLGTSVVQNFSTPALGRSMALLGNPFDGVTVALALAGGAVKGGEGTVRVFGLDPTQPETRRTVAYVPLAPSFPTDITVSELLAFASTTRHDGVHPSETPASRLDRFGLSAIAPRKIGTLSGSELRTVSLVEAFTSPVVRAIVIDEPRLNVLPAVAAVLNQKFSALVRAGGAVLIGTASARDAVDLVDAVAVVRGGRFFTSVRSNELLVSPPGSECYIRVLAQDGERLTAALGKHLNPNDVAFTNGTVVIRGADPLVIADALAEVSIEANVDILELRHVLPTLPGAGGASP